MITAKQAKENSDKCYLSPVSGSIEEINRVLECIEKQSVNGCYFVRLKYIDKLVKIVLKRLGYKIVRGNFFDFDYFSYYVSWVKFYDKCKRS